MFGTSFSELIINTTWIPIYLNRDQRTVHVEQILVPQQNWFFNASPLSSFLTGTMDFFYDLGCSDHLAIATSNARPMNLKYILVQNSCTCFFITTQLQGSLHRRYIPNLLYILINLVIFVIKEMFKIPIKLKKIFQDLNC